LLQIDEGTIHQRALELAGIDDGVFFFHIGHGNGGVRGPSARNGAETGTFECDLNSDPAIYEAGKCSDGGQGVQIEWEQFGLGNCSSDGSATGELRYLWLCSCRAFGHGPPKDDNDGRGVEYDRPSEFDSADPSHANVFTRVGSALSNNMRMACGVSTTAHCSNPDHVAAYLKDAYFYEGLSVADSWGSAHTQRHSDRGDHPLTDINDNPIFDSSGNQMTRNIYQTPICIARGNFNPHDLRSPITDDQRFSEKANPYDEALHIVYWETYASVVEEGTGTTVGKVPTKSDRRLARDVTPYIKVANDASLDNKKENISATLEEQIRQLPVLLTVPASPAWFAEGERVVADEKFLEVAKTLEKYYVKNDTLFSKETTRDGRPKIKADTRMGKVSLAGNRMRVSATTSSNILSLEKYAEVAKGFIEGQGWSESDMGPLVAVKAGLQVVPLNSKVGARVGASKLLKTQKDITFYIGRVIPTESISAKVLGSDNKVVVQMNNDGSIIRASKRWSKITERVKGIPVKNFKTAYAEALQQLGNRVLYELQDWHWGYKSIVHKDGKEMMVVFYAFTFEPLSMVAACIDSPRVIEIQGHILSANSQL
jgi:hypothetical protein